MHSTGARFTRSVILLWLVVSLAACAPAAQPQATPLPVSQTTSITPEPPQGQEYPATPEEVIRAFLIVYPSTPENGIQYLSPAYVQTLNEKTATELLPQPGEIHGFIIEEGAVSPGTEQSQVLTSIAYTDQSYRVRFFLVIQDGHWCIENISLE